MSYVPPVYSSIPATPPPPREITCPTCGAEAGRPCKTMTYGTITMPHSARWKKSSELREHAWRTRK